MEAKSEILERVKKLEEKYATTGQDLSSYLDGLLYAEYLTYWDYVHLDILLNLQNPKTNFPDEKVFIIYHQITELYFKLILLSLEQIATAKNLSAEFFIMHLKRVNSYFENLTRSYEIMIEGMDKEQFLKFRMSLLPASGFQSAQYRMIEICSTDLSNLVSLEKRNSVPANEVEKLFELLYWRQGATELATGKKTLTLRQFEIKYSRQFIQLAKEYSDKNMWQCYQKLSEQEKKNEILIEELKKLDMNANVFWPLAHFKSAVRYLDKKPEAIAATGGTNWQKYLPPKNQRIVFFPLLWTREELMEWGKHFSV